MARCLLKDIFLSQGQDMLTSNDGESIRHSLFKLGLQGRDDSREKAEYLAKKV